MSTPSHANASLTYNICLFLCGSTHNRAASNKGKHAASEKGKLAASNKGKTNNAKELFRSYECLLKSALENMKLS